MTLKRILILSILASTALSTTLLSTEASAFIQESGSTPPPPPPPADTPPSDATTDTDTDTSKFLDREGLATLLDIPVDDPKLAELTDDQVIAMNQSLNGWTNNSFDVSLPEGLIDRILADGLNARQIRAVLKGAQEEAKFNTLADRMAEKAEQTGNPKMLEQAEKLREQGSAQKEKFEGQVSKFADDAAEGDEAAESEAPEADATDDDADDDTDESAGKFNDRATAGKARRAFGKSAANAAKENAKNNAKVNAKANAKASAKAAAKNAAKNAAKSAAKEKAKNAAKNRGRGRP